MGIRTLDLFSGGGGSSYGARAAGAEIVCGVDAWEWATTAYAANFGKEKAVRLTLDAKSSRADLGNNGKLGCHVFRATGITAYLEAGGTLENAQAMATHESPRTTKLYDRTGDQITLDEVERIQI